MLSLRIEIVMSDRYAYARKRLGSGLTALFWVDITR